MKLTIFQNTVMSDIGPCRIFIEWDTERKEFRSERETPLQSVFSPMSAEDAMIIMSNGLELSVDDVYNIIKDNEIVDPYASEIRNVLAELDLVKLKELMNEYKEDC